MSSLIMLYNRLSATALFSASPSAGSCIRNFNNGVLMCFRRLSDDLHHHEMEYCRRIEVSCQRTSLGQLLGSRSKPYARRYFEQHIVSS